MKYQNFIPEIKTFKKLIKKVNNQELHPFRRVIKAHKIGLAVLTAICLVLIGIISYLYVPFEKVKTKEDNLSNTIIQKEIEIKKKEKIIEEKENELKKYSEIKDKMKADFKKCEPTYYSEGYADSLTTEFIKVSKDNDIPEDKKLSPYFYYALAWSESSFNPNIRHFYDFVIGLMGVHWLAWKEELIKNKIAREKNDLKNIKVNIKAGAFIFNYYYKKNHFNLRAALKEYKGIVNYKERDLVGAVINKAMRVENYR